MTRTTPLANMTMFPEPTRAEIIEAQRALEIMSQTRQSKTALEDLLSILDMQQTQNLALSTAAPDAATKKSYSLMLIYQYCDKKTYHEALRQQAQLIIAASQQALPFGQMYGVLALTKLALESEVFIQHLIHINAIASLLALLEQSQQNFYEVQLLSVIFGYATKTRQELNLAEQTKTALLELVARGFQERIVAQGEGLAQHGQLLLNILQHIEFRSQSLEVNLLTQACISLSAWFVHKEQQLRAGSNQYSKNELEIVVTLIRIISVVFVNVQSLTDSKVQEHFARQSLQVIQEMDVFRIAQILTDYMEEAALFFAMNAPLVSFCEASFHRFSQPGCISFNEFSMQLLKRYPAMGVHYIYGGVLNEQILTSILEDKKLVEAIYAVCSRATEGVIDDVSRLIGAMFRSSVFYVDFSALTLPEAFSEPSKFVRYSAVVDEFFQLALQHSVQFDREGTHEALYYLANLKPNLLPFLHPASSVQLLRNKFRIVQDRAMLPCPTQEELTALVQLLLRPDIKISAHAPLALGLFARFPDHSSFFRSNSKLICTNAAKMLARLEQLCSVLAKKQSGDEEQMQAAALEFTREAMTEVLKLIAALASLNAHDAGDVLRLWAKFIVYNEQYGKETAKYVHFILKHGGKALIKDIQGEQVLEIIAK